MTNENETYINETGNTKRSTNAENLIPAGTLGGFLCREVGTGVEFSLGAGGSHEERQKLWAERAEHDDYKGDFVRFKHMPYGRDVKPRQPIFDAFRLKEDVDLDGDSF
ncbi:ATP-dependent DNA ligase [Aeromonas phage Gekk3-15]